MHVAAEKSRTLLVAALAAALAGCATGPRPFTCEARGGPAWREWRSAHFEILSDVPAERVASLAAQFEQLASQVVVGMAGDGAQVPGVVRVVALDDPRVFEELAGADRIGGYFLIAGLEGRPTIVVPVRWTGVAGETVAHELAHVYSRWFFPRQPHWFAEGLAEFYQSLGSGDPSARGRAGAVDASRAAWLGRMARVAPRVLLTASAIPDSAMRGEFHLSSWLLYHWLWNERSADLSAYQERLARLEPPAQAWRASFPDLDPGSDGAMAGLASLLEAYRRSGRIATWAIEARFDGSVRELRQVPSADVHLLLRDVRPAFSRTAVIPEQRLQADTDEQLREDPFHPIALARVASREKRPILPDLRRSVQARPGDWRGWFLLGSALLDGTPPPEAKSEAEASYRRALELAPDEAKVHNALARLLAKEGRSGEALPSARKAASLAPWNGSILDTLAFVLADLGRCREALALQDRAVALTPDSEGLRQRLVEYRARCGEAPVVGGR